VTFVSDDPALMPLGTKFAKCRRMKREICRKKLKAFVGGAGICHAANKLILLAFLLTCHALIGASAASTTCSPVSPIGANKFDLLNQYLGIASGGDGGVRYRD
jgi:hypothetical protein